MKHTPGPLAAREDLLPSWVIESNDCFVARTLWNDEPNVRLLTAAFNSYDKHCGERAIECAEDDLLGAALKALKTCPSLAYVDPVLAKWWATIAMPVIAKATGSEVPYKLLQDCTRLQDRNLTP